MCRQTSAFAAQEPDVPEVHVQVAKMVLPDLSSTLLMWLPPTVIVEPLVDAGMLKFEVLGMLTAGQASLW